MHKLQHYLRQHPHAVAAVAVALVVVVLYLRRPMSVSAAVAEKLAAYPDSIRYKFTALLAAFESMGYTVVVTSTYRPAIDGEPNIHSLWRAIDVNVINNATGKMYTKATPKAEWQATNLPHRAKMMGWRWGGDFTTPYVYKGTTYAGYDPIHFDLGYPA